MEKMHIVLLLCLTVAAVLADLRSGRIPNGIIAAGLMCAGAYQIYTGGVMGLILYLGGLILPVLLLGIFFCLRMIGAGDVKLLCMAGGFFGPSGCLDCIVQSVVWGGLLSAAVMLSRRNAGRRLVCLAEYIGRSFREGRWGPYLDGDPGDGGFCFSVPILLGIFCHIGGTV